VKEVHGLCVSSMTSVCCVYMCECLVYEIHVVCVYVSVLHSCGALVSLYCICGWCGCLCVCVWCMCLCVCVCVGVWV
jgi:hypothetical protein